jgi:hypothetical protein
VEIFSTAAAFREVDERLMEGPEWLCLSSILKEGRTLWEEAGTAEREKSISITTSKTTTGLTDLIFV